MNPESLDRRGRVFEALYRDGYTYSIDNPELKRKKRFNLRVEHVCDVNFPTGQVVACDPTDGLSFGAEPFIQTIRRGKYPIFVSVAGPSRRPIVMSAKLQLESTPPIKWEMALRPKQNTKRLKKDEYFGFGVDCGMAAIGDYETFQTTKAKHVRDEWWSTVVDGWKTHHEWNVPSSKQHGLAIFDSGYGDGYYPSFWGKTKRGGVICLVVDFCVVPWGY